MMPLGWLSSPCSILVSPLNPNGLFSQRRLWQCAGDCVKRRFRISGRIYSYPSTLLGLLRLSRNPSRLRTCRSFHTYLVPTDLGIFAREELNRKDTLNELMHWWKNPIEIVLGLFGLANAGVVFNSLGTGTYLVLFGLLVGKPVGICLFTILAKSVFRLEIPAGMTMQHILLIGIISSIGFTVALFVSTAFPAAGDVLDGAKMGALLSFVGAL